MNKINESIEVRKDAGEILILLFETLNKENKILNFKEILKITRWSENKINETIKFLLHTKMIDENYNFKAMGMIIVAKENMFKGVFIIEYNPTKKFKFSWELE